jgi:hypothetical protein
MGKRIVFTLGITLLMGLAGPAIAQIDPATVTTGHVYTFDNVSGTTVPDDSANSNDGSIVGSPEVVSGLGSNALHFDGVDDGVYIPDSGNINTGGPHTNRTVVAVFNCDDVDKSEKQTIFEEGGRTRGATIYVHEGLVYVGAWNRAEYDWNGAWLSAPIGSGEWHSAAFIIRDGGDAVEDDKFEFWLDGRLVETAPGGQLVAHANDNGIGYTVENNVFHDDDGSGDGFYFEGTIDEVWILNDALTAAEMTQWAGNWPFAAGPKPGNGALHEEPWVELSWSAGAFAITHDVYFGTSFEDVANGVEGTLIASTDRTSQIVGIGNNPIPEGLQPGTTYYWRVDEVNDANPDGPWKGTVWSFTIQPAIAWNPFPPDGLIHVDPDQDLMWSAADKTFFHTIYFGQSHDEVEAATEGGWMSTQPTYDPGTLELDTTYYWRVDEFKGTTTDKGEVWSFTTRGEGGGVRAEYFAGMALEGDPPTIRGPGYAFDYMLPLGHFTQIPSPGGDDVDIPDEGEISHGL